jgi:hypothetical protein
MLKFSRAGCSFLLDIQAGDTAILFSIFICLPLHSVYALVSFLSSTPAIDFEKLATREEIISSHHAITRQTLSSLSRPPRQASVAEECEDPPSDTEGVHNFVNHLQRQKLKNIAAAGIDMGLPATENDIFQPRQLLASQQTMSLPSTIPSTSKLRREPRFQFPD